MVITRSERIVILRAHTRAAVAQNRLESRAIEGDSPVRGATAYRVVFRRVGLFDIAALSGRYTSSKAKYMWETDSVQVL